MALLKHINFIKIKGGSKEYFGGNQTWWKRENDSMSEYGCGVIASCNLELYVSGVGLKGITYEEYKSYVDKRHGEAYFLNQRKKLRSLGLLPIIMERGLDKFYHERNMEPIISWCPTVNKKRIRKLIEKMLKNDIPIVASYYVFNKKNKLDLYTYNKKNKSFEISSGIRRHYFNIVGITRREGNDMLIISTWGQRYYVLYDQWVKKLSIFSNILYIE